MSKVAEKPPANDLYDVDFFAWTKQQADLLRAKRWADLDLENLAEEVESVGKSQRSEIENRLVVLLTHLLKWRFQPGRQGKSWRSTIWEQRRRLHQTLAQNPSLKDYPSEVLDLAYLSATLKAEEETGIDIAVFPEASPFTLEQVLDNKFLPEDLGHIGSKKKK